MQRCSEDARQFEAASHLYADWARFAEEQGEQAGTAKQFGGLMAKRGYRSKNMRIHGQQQKVSQGIGLLPRSAAA